MATSSSSFVEIRDGVSLETRQYGDATGSKALVVWGHGLCNSLEGEDEDMLWDFWAKKTVGEGDIDGRASTDDDAGAIEMGANVVRYSARGHGESSPSTAPADCAWDTLGGDMLDLARRQRRDASQKLILGGASMGAASAIHAAVRVQRERERAGSDPVSNPNEIAGLVLVIVPTFHESRRRRRTQILAAAERGYDSFYKSKKPRPIFRGTDRGRRTAASRRRQGRLVRGRHDGERGLGPASTGRHSERLEGSAGAGAVLGLRRSDAPGGERGGAEGDARAARGRSDRDVPGGDSGVERCGASIRPGFVRMSGGVGVR